MPTATIFYDPTSEPCRAVHWFCLQAGIAHELEYVWLTRDEHLSQAFLAINPQHQVPALKHGEFCLSEATAMMQYLAELSGCSEQWFGSDIKQRAVINKLLSWYHTNLRRHLTLDYFLPELLMPAYFEGFPRQPGAAADKLESLHKTLTQLNGFLTDKPYLAGNELSAADIVFASEMSALAIDPDQEGILSEYHNIRRWLSTLQQLKAYAESHKTWHHLASLINEPGFQPQSNPAWVAETCERFISSE